MNILILCCEGGVAGSTLSISYLARGLAQRGHQVFVGCKEETLLFSLLDAPGVVRVPMKLNRRLGGPDLRRIRDLVVDHGIDVINAQSSKDRYLSIFARWLYRLPVSVIHTRRQMPRSDGGPLQSLLYRHGTDKVIAVSRGVKEDLTRKRIPAAHIEVIHNGTPPEKYRVPNIYRIAAVRSRLKLNRSDRVIGCVSRRKSQEHLLEALQGVDCATTVLFVGIDSDERLEALRAKVSDRHRVLFVGAVPTSEVLDYYSLFSLVVMPSIMEGLSQSLMEAMALGVPVIATRAGGNEDLIRHGENGYLYGVSDIAGLGRMIGECLSDRKSLTPIIDEARRTVFEDFSVAKTVERHEALFERCCRERANDRWSPADLPRLSQAGVREVHALGSA